MSGEHLCAWNRPVQLRDRSRIHGLEMLLHRLFANQSRLLRLNHLALLRTQNLRWANMQRCQKYEGNCTAISNT